MGQPITHRPPRARASVLSPSMDYKADDGVQVLRSSVPVCSAAKRVVGVPVPAGAANRTVTQVNSGSADDPYRLMFGLEYETPNRVAA